MKHLIQIVLAVICLCSAALAGDFSGKVVDKDGKPVKGATVYCLPYPRGRGWQAATPRDAPTTRSDENGSFHFGQIDGNAELVASAEGQGLGIVSNAMQQTTPVIHLSAGTDVKLTFLAPDKKPAAGISISLQHMYSTARTSGEAQNLWIPPGVRSPWRATTDANGVCDFPGLPQAAQAIFSVDDDRYASLSYRDQVMLAINAVTQADPIQLVAASTISGTVTNAATGAPAAGIVLDAQPNDGSTSSVVTAADGTYTFKQLRPGQYIVALRPGQDLDKTLTAKAVEGVTLASGAAKTGVDLSLIPGVMLTGTVIAADDGSAIAGAPIGIYSAAHPRPGSSPQNVSSDSTGHFSARVPPGDDLVYVMSDTPADGFGRPSPDHTTITIADGATGTVEFRLPRVLTSVIKGKVVDPDGNPVAGAMVYVSSDQLPMYQQNGITAGADGSFQTIPMLRAGKIEVRARFGNMGTRKAIVLTRTSPSEQVIHLEKDALGSISGRVVDPQGQPIRSAKIELIVRMPRYAYGNDAGETDDQGNFKVDSLWPDANYSVEITGSGYGEANSAQLHLQPGQTTNIPDLTLYKRDSNVAGVFLDANEKPIVGQQIQVSGPRTGYSRLTTDADGKFGCAVVSGDRLTVFYRVGESFHRQSAKAGDQNIVLHTAPERAVAAAPARVAAPVASASSQAPPTPEPGPTFNPADAVTWQAWGFAAALLVVGGAITVIANAIAAMRAGKTAQ